MLVNKNELRKNIKDKSALLSEEYIKASSDKIEKIFLESSDYKNCESLFVFVSTDKEPDTSVIIKTALKEGRKVYVPKCFENGKMIPIEITEKTEFEKGFAGIYEPKGCGYTAEFPRIDLAVVPCVSADLNGNRLGHGGGFYDRYLSENSVKKACLCFGELLSNEIVTEKHDVKMDCLITENGIYGF